MKRKMMVALGVCAVLAGTVGADDRELPQGFAPFAHLAGAWKGMGIPKANRLKGWPERHLWAWKFQKGQILGMTLVCEKGKVLAQAQLSFDAAAKRYRLTGQDAEKHPVAYSGSFDPQTHALTLDREGNDSSGAKERLTLRLNTNMIRYTIWLDRQEPGAPQYSRVIDMNMGKEGEEFAAGGSSSSAPKCIVTGGTATMSVSYQGVSYPLCCTGCRDEFNENPAKYIAKAKLVQAKGGDGKKTTTASSVGKDDGAFDGLVDDPKPARPATKPTAARPEPAKAEEAKTKPAPSADPASRAAALLRSAQALDKLGKTSAALEYYRQIVDKYPKTPQAKTASERVKALSSK